MGRDFVVAGRDGAVQLPPDLVEEYPPGTLLDLRRGPDGITLIPHEETDP